MPRTSAIFQCSLFPIPTELLHLRSIYDVSRCFPSYQVKLKEDNLLFATSLRIYLALVRSVSKINVKAFISKCLGFISTEKFDTIKSKM